MTTTMTDDELEVVVRAEPVCRGCGDEKVNGLMCWGCWKHREHCFKYEGMELGAWFEKYGVKA
jgi:hypothetical protein